MGRMIPNTFEAAKIGYPIRIIFRANVKFHLPSNVVKEAVSNAKYPGVPNTPKAMSPPPTRSPTRQIIPPKESPCVKDPTPKPGIKFSTMGRAIFFSYSLHSRLAQRMRRKPKSRMRFLVPPLIKDSFAYSTRRCAPSVPVAAAATL